MDGGSSCGGMTHVTAAATLVGAAPDAAYSAVLALARRLWDLTAEDVLVTSPPDQLMHRVQVDGEVACWLTWTLTPITAATTRVQLVHDEVASRCPPTPELDAVLSLLLDEIRTGVAAPD